MHTTNCSFHGGGSNCRRGDNDASYVIIFVPVQVLLYELSILDNAQMYPWHSHAIDKVMNVFFAIGNTGFTYRYADVKIEV